MANIAKLFTVRAQTLVQAAARQPQVAIRFSSTCEYIPPTKSDEVQSPRCQNLLIRTMELLFYYPLLSTSCGQAKEKKKH